MNSDQSSSKRKGQGKKIDDQISEAIVTTLVSLWLEGRRKRELSADSILDRVAAEQPHLLDQLPSPQTVRRLVGPIKTRLEEGGGELDQPWSLGSVSVASHRIDEGSIPLLLRISKFLALDVGEGRRHNGFKPNRLTVREARWVSKLRQSLGSEEQDRALAPGSESIAVAGLAKRYATRELAAEILGEALDTYDLDMKIAFGVPFVALSGRILDYQLWMLSLELGLIPQSTMSDTGQMLEYELDASDLNATVEVEHTDPRVERAEALVSLSLHHIIRLLADRGHPLKVRFGTRDWRGGTLSQQTWTFGTDADYEINLDILRLIMPLALVHREATDRDPDQVRVATAFRIKILKAAIERLRDPEVLRLFDPTEQENA